jgi:hypothetical protein
LIGISGGGSSRRPRTVELEEEGAANSVIPFLGIPVGSFIVLLITDAHFSHFRNILWLVCQIEVTQTGTSRICMIYIQG